MPLRYKAELSSLSALTKLQSEMIVPHFRNLEEILFHALHYVFWPERGDMAGGFRELLENHRFREALSGHLPPDGASQSRGMVTNRGFSKQTYILELSAIVRNL
jgi:hypothetical protein